MLKVLDLFCGAGGLSKGFEMAGFELIGGVDFNQDAILTHELNFPKSKSICTDIKTIKDNEVFELFGKSVDVIIGGPPCQGFSGANKWQKEIDDPRNKLFFEYIRFVELLRPQAIVIENVKGILKKDNGYAKTKIISILSELGYQMTSYILNSNDFGVPQKRQRAVFIGIRSDIGSFDEKKLIKANNFVTVKEAIDELYILENIKNTTSSFVLKQQPVTEYQKYLRSEDNTIYNHNISYPKQNVIDRMKFVPQGGNWKNVPEILWEKQRSNRHSSAYKRLNEEEPSITIDTGHMNYFHPIFNRVPTVRESARIQSFPDNFIFCGAPTSQLRQVGNAVPPLMAKSIALAIRSAIENENC